MISYDEAKIASVDTLKEGFETQGYISSDQIATAVYIACKLQKPILVEGPPGVGKTELAKATSELLELPLIRMQCYEGLDESKALYEWKYGKQLLYTQVLKEKLHDILDGADNLTDSISRLHEFSDVFYSEEFLEPRPLLKALKSPGGSVMLIDEIDKADHEFESFLLEMLSDYAISIPEIGTITADEKPIVFLTSNNTRELSDALKRRCLHLYIPFPEEKLELAIIKSRVPELSTALNQELVGFIQSLREMDLKKKPAVSETIDWARTLLLLHADRLEPEVIRNTLNVILKHEEDIRTVDDQLGVLMGKAEKAVR
ncbi:MAG: MoxR family ATPase [Gammaproteobacteria bacterium]|nr:MoxR family ATPase [Gammaproteobacteria bacterium]